ncbi:glucan 1,4-alpha-glucosidase [Ancylothrix sp. C2]|uniref:glucan 1,4-alpha-glucosidase n=1 Tax=Ancylothrix sp. D3o TaxID=2953691 RepID=UPI0021BAD2E8|nr:glucan 1,4-alpha-glucosidase [Ancylothrix sp. D3o]MCT7952399.1 glucan 1,4-alpha-glucosidase [Ancylothrix sp. D3o]
MKKFYGSFIAILLILVVVVGNITFTHAFNTPQAFGSPGNCPNWSPSTLTFLGTAENRNSKVWFTGTSGILTQIFYPAVDTPATVDWQFLIGDTAKTWVDEEKQDTTSEVLLNNPHSLAWEISNTAKNQQYKIHKTIFTDPNRNTLIQQVTFTALRGTVGDFNLYTLYHPAISNQGRNTTGYHRQNFLFATNEKTAHTSALTSSLPFTKKSSGFVAKSDGWQDLKATSDFKMDWTFEKASNGNIAQMAMLDLSAYAKQKSITFNLVLGLGESAKEAEKNASKTLKEDLKKVLTTYNQEWENYTNRLNNFGGTADEQYYVAAMTLKASQDKDSGAMVAGLGNPWGNSNGGICTALGVTNSGGYHLIWPRDLYKFASALMVAGDKETANFALDWLLKKGQQNDGHFTQNAWVDGTPYWNGVQMDETAFPIILAWKLGRNDAETYRKNIQPAADYIIKYGPVTSQERWEENGGYSPATIAAEIAGLVCAADIAKTNGDFESQERYLKTADFWQSKVEDWTFTTSGSLGNGRYFERIDGNGNPNDGEVLLIKNGGGFYDERLIVDMSFLELVRHGVKRWDNPAILASLEVVDSTIKQTIPGKGEGWFRYNHDGYGERENGDDYTGAGVGRLWPIFTGERGHFEVARGGKADSYLATMRGFANESLMIPEQVGDLNSPAGFVPGTPTKSMTPLNWSMGEYITLFASNYLGRVSDMPVVVFERYGGIFEPQMNADKRR